MHSPVRHAPCCTTPDEHIRLLLRGTRRSASASQMTARSTAILPGILLLGYTLAAKAQSGSAAAQTPQFDAPAGYWDRTLPVPRRALELTLSTSLVAGLGQAADHANDHVSQTVNSGTSFQLGVGYRASPAWMLGVSTAYEPYDKGPADSSATKTEGAVARAGVTYHFSPSSRTAPWVSGGAGYRWLRETGTAASKHDFHGFELANLATGLDLRVAPRVAFGPALGVAINALLWDGSHFTAEQNLSVFWYLGVQARVDLAGSELNVNNVALR
jgi:Autotransporter beta-domain